MNQAAILTALGCSGSLVLSLWGNDGAIAAPLTPTQSPTVSTPTTQVQPLCQQVSQASSQGNNLLDQLGCTCPSCNPNAGRDRVPQI